jgi:hypothetical protein
VTEGFCFLLHSMAWVCSEQNAPLRYYHAYSQHGTCSVSVPVTAMMVDISFSRDVGRFGSGRSRRRGCASAPHGGDLGPGSVPNGTVRHVQVYICMHYGEFKH